jgi:hypothetical protein
VPDIRTEVAQHRRNEPRLKNIETPEITMRTLPTLALCAAALLPCSATAATAPLRLDLQLRDTPLRETVKRVFTPAGVKVRLDADVADLKVTLNLKAADPEHAIRLLVRQGAKQVPELAYEATEEGFRIFREAKEAKPEEPLKFKSRETPPAVSESPVLSQPTSEKSQLEGSRTSTAGTEEGTSVDPGSVFSEADNQGIAPTPGRPGGVLVPGGFYVPLPGADKTKSKFPKSDAYAAPVGSGKFSSLAREKSDPKKKTGPLPYFYNHRSGWILEPRTRFWRKTPTRKPLSNGGKSPNGAGYAPGNPFPVR